MEGRPTISMFLTLFGAKGVLNKTLYIQFEINCIYSQPPSHDLFLWYI